MGDRTPALDPLAEGAIEPWREPVRGGFQDASLLSMPGLEWLRHFLDGSTPRAPLHHLTGLRMVEVGAGSAAFEMPLSDWLRSPQGPVSVGALSIPADAALGCAVQTVLPAGVAMTTSELSLRLLAPAHAGQTVLARASVVHAGRTLALSEGTVTDANGELLAHGSSLCVLVAPAGVPGGTAGGSAHGPGSGLDPWARPAQGASLDQGVWGRMSGLEILEAIKARELPAPPIAHLIGLRIDKVTSGATTFAMPASEWLCAPPRGRAQGGVVALLAETAIGGAIQTTLSPGTALAQIDLKVNYLRPLATDGRTACADGRVLHSGRRIAVASAEVRDADRRLIAVATGSAMLLPGRPASLADAPR